ncbi:MAG: ornithine carbamoyltransferase [Omnitrophica WOR_2 bacterium RIFCSPHIGHO2_02_FULL_50_17]|nr:MAG: ornithine carbamoyltransferase [Omnitrophica WOR_2 bacterium RIFCSPHIGHO2_02_FULL_50_17]
METMKRDFLSLQDLTQEEILALLKRTYQLKRDKTKMRDYLRGKSIGLLFQKPSNRTRVSFEVGISQLGGNCLYLGPEEINLGVRESTADVAKTLSRYLDAIVARTFHHQDVVDLARYATIPVINGLSDMYHPCQSLTDMFSIEEKLGTTQGVVLGYVGDGNNNVCHSLMIGCAKTGISTQIATPKGYEPDPKVVRQAKSLAQETGAFIHLTRSPKDAVAGADVIYSDVWVSMGQEKQAPKRLKDFKGFQINGRLVQGAKDKFIFMHCLPAHRGQEVTADVIDGEHSIVFDQAENRLHVQKAVLTFLIEKSRQSGERGGGS